MSHQRVGRGGTIILTGNYRIGGTTGPLVDPTNPRIDILNADDLELVTDAIPTRQSLGTFTYEYTVATDAPLGVWTAHWTGAINNTPVSGDDLFEVMPAGSVSFEEESFATLEDFELRKGDVAGEDEDTVRTLLVDATALIRDEIADTTVEWLEQTTPVPLTVRAVCVEAAYRAWTNPDGLARSAMADSSIAYASGRGPEALFLTDAEKRTVRRAAGESSGATSVTLVSPFSGDDAESDEPELVL